MNRFILPLLAMAFASPVSAQTSEPNPGWAGGYLGLQVGYAADSVFEFQSLPGFETDLTGVIGGGQIGFRRQTDEFVYGGELEFAIGEQDLAGGTGGSVNVRTSTIRLGGQAGYSFGRIMPYGSVGVARMTLHDTVGFGDTFSYGAYGGIGVEYQVGAATSVALEAVRENFQNFTGDNDAGVAQTNLCLLYTSPSPRD